MKRAGGPRPYVSLAGLCRGGVPRPPPGYAVTLFIQPLSSGDYHKKGEHGRANTEGRTRKGEHGRANTEGRTRKGEHKVRPYGDMRTRGARRLGKTR